MNVTPTIEGRQYWLSLEQLANSPEFAGRVHDEFQGYDPDAISSMSRRKFMRLMAGSMALAGLTLSGCRRYPEEKIAPHARQPEGRIPGTTVQYATSYEIAGVSTGLLAASFDGRPIKVDGNPNHPISLGASDAIAQASVLELYDPSRARTVTTPAKGTGRLTSSWDSFSTSTLAALETLKAKQGEGLALLCEATTSLTIATAKARLMAAYPKAQWFEYEPISGDNAIEGARLAFGRPVRAQLQLSKARVIASFDSDLFGAHPAKLKHSREWAIGRRSADNGVMNRVYVAESRYSVTGGVADERMAVKPSRIETILAALAGKLGIEAGTPDALTEREMRFIELLTADLQREGGNAVVTVGDHHSPAAHALGFRINAKLGAIGHSVTYIAVPGGDRPTHAAAITALTTALRSNAISHLLILGGNPVYDAPADLDFAAALGKTSATHLSLFLNETSQACSMHLPRAHYLESWGDGRSYDGMIALTQPLILPLYEGKSIAEVVAFLADGRWTDGYELIRTTMATVLPDDQFERAWRRSLHDGIVRGTSSQPVPVQLAQRSEQERSGEPLVHATSNATTLATSAGKADTFDLVFYPSELHDGRFAGSGWLQEAPDPMTKLTWDNAALISKRDADALSIRTGDVITISIGKETLDIAAYIMPGQPAGAIALSLGYGRTVAGPIGTNVGFNTYALRTTRGLGHISGATLKNTGKRYPLAMTQDHHLIDAIGFKGREKRTGEKGESGSIIKDASLTEYKKDKNFATKDDHGNIHLQLFNPPESATDKEGHAWGMAIDMASCIGCNACVIACQAENNIPIVGKDEVIRNREMHWIRIDRYFKGGMDDEEPQVVHQPIMCVHCENAPCEQVCPVAATVHDTEGLNTMVYNRCIGTRYCSNNCPYKVRRFNYFDFHVKDPRGSATPWLAMPDTQQREGIDPIKQMVFNPQVTVRMRGVMEKCTYCVQRIQSAKISRRNKGQTVQDGDVVTACQSACPTQAIVFGDLNDKNSNVRKAHDNSRAYSLLGDLNVRPRTKHLAKLRNPATTP